MTKAKGPDSGEEPRLPSLRDYLVSERGWTLYYDVTSFVEYRKGPLQLECEFFDGGGFWKVFNTALDFRSNLLPVLRFLLPGDPTGRALNNHAATKLLLENSISGKRFLELLIDDVESTRITIHNVDMLEKFLLNEPVDGKTLDQFKIAYPNYRDVLTYR